MHNDDETSITEWLYMTIMDSGSHILPNEARELAETLAHRFNVTLKD